MSAFTPGLPIDIDLSEDITDISIINHRGDTVAEVSPEKPSDDDTTEVRAYDFISDIRGVFHL